ncbi:hypothetical protein GEMRC1_001326 [Eukaryota sp. GEM-RC1]
MDITTAEQMSGKHVPPFTVFIPTSKAWDLKFQAKTDAEGGFPPLHVVSEDQLQDLSPHYDVAETAFVYTFTTPEGTNECGVLNWNPENLAGMFLSVSQTRKYSKDELFCLFKIHVLIILNI